MRLDPKFRTPRAPTISSRAVQVTHQKELVQLAARLQDIESACSQFIASMVLHCQSNELCTAATEKMNSVACLVEGEPVTAEISQVRSDAFSAYKEETYLPDLWNITAGRNGVLSAYTYIVALNKSNEIINKIPTLRAHCNNIILNGCLKKFNANFSNMDDFRHAIAHPEYYGRPGKKSSIEDQNIPDFLEADPGSGPVQMTNGWIGDNFTCTFNGRFVSCEISHKKSNILLEITKDYFEEVGRIGQICHPNYRPGDQRTW